MPIELEFPVQPVTQEQFHAVDRVFTGLVFESQNELGNLCDEKIYQNDVVSRCAARGFEAAKKEFRITVRHGDFTKTYRVDVLLNRGVVYELKCAERIAGAHETQALHYLFLAGLQHGKVFNFQTERVEFRFVSTHLTPELRHKFRIIDNECVSRDPDSEWFKQTMVALLHDWGAFLDFELFYEAIRCFRGGEHAVIHSVEMKVGDRPVGTQKAHLLNPSAAFKISAVTKNVIGYEIELQKWLSLTSLECIQWVNFNRHNIEFRTLVQS